MQYYVLILIVNGNNGIMLKVIIIKIRETLVTEKIKIYIDFIARFTSTV